MRAPRPDGGSGYYVVTDGTASVPARASRAAGDGDVLIHGGATAVNRYVAADLADEPRVHQAPFTLGAGARLFADVPPLTSTTNSWAVQARPSTTAGATVPAGRALRSPPIDCRSCRSCQGARRQAEL
ncbi:dihydrofolate reductase family protein [Streptomyces clavifer]|uniref:dihydrofolate reductase family protein n=1 Tax=Streptomyces clavifer TaxID=68188 RepID=UPI003332C286